MGASRLSPQKPQPLPIRTRFTFRPSCRNDMPGRDRRFRFDRISKWSTIALVFLLPARQGPTMRWFALLSLLWLPGIALAADVPPDWAYKPVSKPAVPKSAAKNPIDAFVLAKLSDKGLSLTAPADKRTLLRR